MARYSDTHTGYFRPHPSDNTEWTRVDFELEWEYDPGCIRPEYSATVTGGDGPHWRSSYTGKIFKFIAGDIFNEEVDGYTGFSRLMRTFRECVLGCTKYQLTGSVAEHATANGD